MTKKISIEQLKPGMFVADIGSDWMAHPFLRRAFAVKGEAMAEKIAAAGIHEVYIDPSRGDDVADAPTQQEVTAYLENEMLSAATEPVSASRITVSEELVHARKVHGEANRIVHDIMKDVRLGKQVTLEKAEPVVEKLTDSILRNGGALLSLCRVKSKDDYTFLHSVSVCVLQVSFARALGMDAGTIQQAGIGGLLHDIGKVRVPDVVLNKPGRLTEDEFEVMKCHAVESRKILSETDGIEETSILIAAQHHERHDGSGYPEGLKGEAISQMGQMAAICDVYDAITSDRVYHKGLVPHEALRKIFEWSKFHFNPLLVQSFLRTIGIYPVGTLVRLESGLLGIVIEQSQGNLLQPTVKLVYDTTGRQYLPTPRTIDLSRPLGSGGGDRIIGHEAPSEWGMDPLRLML